MTNELITELHKEVKKKLQPMVVMCQSSDKKECTTIAVHGRTEQIFKLFATLLEDNPDLIPVVTVAVEAVQLSIRKRAANN